MSVHGNEGSSPYEKYKRERLKLTDAILGEKKEESSNNQGYKTKHSVIAKGPISYATLERRRRRRNNDNDDDIAQLTAYLGYRPQSVEVVDSRDMTYDSQTGWS